jgi:hypothetical protein
MQKMFLLDRKNTPSSDDDRIIWLMGGLGNVLFQLFYAKLLSKNGYNVELCLKLTERNYYTRLMGWTIHKNSYIYFIDDYKISNQKNIYPALLAFLDKKLGFSFGFVTFIQNKHKFLTFGNEKHIFGYFQNRLQINYFRDIFLEFCENISKNISNNLLYSHVVHFRLGDSNWGLNSQKYYNFIKAKLQDENGVVIVTDSTEKATSFFKDISEVQIISSSDPFSDFLILANCEYLYCGPSTFSWWASHLSSALKEVYMPSFLLNKLGFYKKNVKLFTETNKELSFSD